VTRASRCAAGNRRQPEVEARDTYAKVIDAVVHIKTIRSTNIVTTIDSGGNTTLALVPLGPVEVPGARIGCWVL